MSETISTLAQFEALPELSLFEDSRGVRWVLLYKAGFSPTLASPQDWGTTPAMIVVQDRGPLTLLYRPDRPQPIVLPSEERVLQAISHAVDGSHLPDRWFIKEATRAVRALFDTSAEQHAGHVVEMHFSDGKPKVCGNCDDCCPCCEADDPDPEGVYLTVKLDDSAARARFGAVTVTYSQDATPPADRARP